MNSSRMMLVRLFRRDLGDTQFQFAIRVKAAMPTVQRWEKTRPPDAYAIALLIHAAERAHIQSWETRWYIELFRELKLPAAQRIAQQIGKVA